MRFLGYDHVGIRVCDPERALDFYRRLGFAIDPEFTDDQVAEIVAPDGTRINLIFNGVSRANNVLLDEPIKWPGYTHGAFIVDSLEELVGWAARENVPITEGPVDWGRRLTCFLRDPDGNVLEFNELLNGPGHCRASEPGRLVLHEYSASGNAYKVRLTASHLRISLERREYDIFQGETRTPEFLEHVGATGRIPVLQIGDRLLPESNAICCYLGAGSALIPTDRLDHADMLRWMCFEQYNIEPNLSAMYIWPKLGENRLSEVQRTLFPAKMEGGRSALKLLDGHLAARNFLLDRGFSLADIAVYAYTHLAGEAGLDLDEYPAVRDWLTRVAEQPGHIAAVPLILSGED